MRIRTLFIFVCACYLAVIVVHAQRFDDAIREDFFAGITGDTTRFDRAMKMCEVVLESDTNNAPALVWHGAGLLVRSGSAFRAGNTADGIDLRIRAMHEMDRAVEMAPEDIQVLIPRAAILVSNARFSPDEQTRSMARTAAADYEKVLAMESRRPDRGVHSVGELLGGLATAYRLAGESAKAISFLQRISRELPGTVYDRKAQSWLADVNAVPKTDHFCLGCHAK